ncbi:MAG: family 20 glycosylhydrolase [Ginsengibacter sp.]
MKIKLCLFFYFAFAASTLFANDINIIPQPVKMSQGKGNYMLKNNLSISIDKPTAELSQMIKQFSGKIATATGCQISIHENKNEETGGIHLSINSTNNSEIGDEGYQLSVNQKGIFISANKPAGLYYGMTTMMQLLPKEIESNQLVKMDSWSVPFVEITDYPRFKWRGMMMDVSRHFFTVDEVKQHIDNMVKYKYNMFHWHLTDDQGWRIEIESLPKLTSVGAWRAPRIGRWGEFSKPTPDEPKTYGGFYTHNDIKEIIQYAADRFVTVMPEIDVPGHSLAAVASYPELSCTPGTYQVNSGDKFMVWEKGTFYGLVDNTLCPANENVYTFLDKVFTEVAALFPFDYIHIGGDEAYKGYWAKSDAVKQLMKKEGLKDQDEVQSYFIKRVEKIVESKGKKIIGWDEILDGGLAPNATVMSWRGMKGGMAAAKMNHHVVMTPNDFVYFDLYQGDPVAEPITYGKVLLNKAYEFDPLPKGVDPKWILGGQCNLWAERLNTVRHAQYMLWPRALATAECVWSPVSVKDWNSFYHRVEGQMERMDIAQTDYSRSMYDPSFTSKFDDKDSLVIQMDTQIDSLDIYYSFDEFPPDNFYPKYKTPLSIPKDAANLKVVTYRKGMQVGRQITMPIEEMRKRAAKK